MSQNFFSVFTGRDGFRCAHANLGYARAGQTLKTVQDTVLFSYQDQFIPQQILPGGFYDQSLFRKGIHLGLPCGYKQISRGAFLDLLLEGSRGCKIIGDFDICMLLLINSLKLSGSILQAGRRRNGQIHLVCPGLRLSAPAPGHSRYQNKYKPQQ
ncbi:MAG: hypothetical protein BWY80_00825 [Firmicutes bacterium ADurb.Bin456]|nr:MAG: hypothetical protein BWY80_00825 [Firmicutes bacterium ADurb.Bin456]